ncbi:hypothetical protein A4L51_00530 [Salmonella enterica subsp. enterica serovar Newport]|nr:hypothetical protein [Salmonella enterica subsp. enterica serovar Newport]
MVLVGLNKERTICRWHFSRKLLRIVILTDKKVYDRKILRIMKLWPLTRKQKPPVGFFVLAICYLSVIAFIGCGESPYAAGLTGYEHLDLCDIAIERVTVGNQPTAHREAPGTATL